jgi:tyrosine-protein phosphatase SIW14
MERTKNLMPLFLSFLFASTTFAASTDLPHFFEVAPGKIYRGAQPTDVGIQDLAHMGVKTIIDMREEKNWIQHERTVASENGLKFISVPLSSLWQPSDQDINTIETALNNPQLQPVFVHCQHGEDRTGLVIGLYRVFTENSDPRTAYQEMHSLGFHKILLGLYSYYKQKTGFDD